MIIHANKIVKNMRLSLFEYFFIDFSNPTTIGKTILNGRNVKIKLNYIENNNHNPQSKFIF